MSGSQCCENPPTLSSSSGGGGSVAEIGGLKAYITGPSDSKLAILLISDIYGYEAPNLRKLADKVASIGFYVVSHGTDKGFEDAKPAVVALRSKGIHAIGAAGFSKVVVELAKSEYIQAAVLLHPSVFTVDDIKEIKAPIAFEEVLYARPEIKGYVKIFPGVAHGWTVRYKTEDEKAVKHAEEAHQNILDWFTEHVK
ncbi:hypothetical protein SLA2020_208930 [Shorea laevis]